MYNSCRTRADGRRHVAVTADRERATIRHAFPVVSKYGVASLTR